MYQLFAQKTMKNTPRGASRQGARSPREWCLASLTLSFAFANIVTLPLGQRNSPDGAEKFSGRSGEYLRTAQKAGREPGIGAVRDRETGKILF